MKKSRPRPITHSVRDLQDAEAFLARQHTLPDVEPPISPRHFLSATKRAAAFTRQIQTFAARGRRLLRRPLQDDTPAGPAADDVTS